MDTYDYYEDNTLTNFHKKERPVYEQAIKEYQQRYGKEDVAIRDTAYDGFGNLLRDCHAIIAYNLEDKTDFWKIVDEIRLLLRSRSGYLRYSGRKNPHEKISQDL